MARPRESGDEAGTGDVVEQERERRVTAAVVGYRLVDRGAKPATASRADELTDPEPRRVDVDVVDGSHRTDRGSHRVRLQHGKPTVALCLDVAGPPEHPHRGARSFGPGHIQ
jgi:hypothetical protein